MWEPQISHNKFLFMFTTPENSFISKYSNFLLVSHWQTDCKIQSIDKRDVLYRITTDLKTSAHGINLHKLLTFFLCKSILTHLKLTANFKIKNILLSLHSTFLKKLSKPICYKKRHINKTVYTVIQACFSATVNLATRLIHTLLPAYIIKFMDLQERKCAIFTLPCKLCSIWVITCARLWPQKQW
jgi:hypothetical protein